MRCYIATALENVGQQKRVATALTALGHELTYDWSVHGSVQHQPERWAEVATSESGGVLAAELVVVLLPGGRGTHTELGLALAALGEPRIIIVGPLDGHDGRTCVFYHHPRVWRHFAVVEELLAFMDGFGSTK